MRETSRQEFLEPELGYAQSHLRIGIVGLSGGGSHIAQQLVHIGFRDFTLYDPKRMEEKHLHRVVGCTIDDADTNRAKVEVISRVIRDLQPSARITAIPRAWHDEPEPLRLCDVVFGCVDTFRGRDELESMCRRYGIPYVDIGIDVFRSAGEPPRMAGQVFLSIPDGPCMRCVRLIRPELLDKEGAEYGEQGGRPQVVWLNALVASAAIGLVVDLVTAKFGHQGPPIYVSLDGNRNTLTSHANLLLAQEQCPHYRANHLGDPRPSANN